MPSTPLWVIPGFLVCHELSHSQQVGIIKHIYMHVKYTMYMYYLMLVT